MYINKFFLILFIECIFSTELSNEKFSFYQNKAKSLNGEIIDMKKYYGKKILIVNVASKCGYTSQYEGLQNLHNNYNNDLYILGFPSNDFLWQEPGTNKEIQTFCKLNYGVTFQMFEKISVKGKNQHPIYNWLSSSELNGWNDKVPTWNFFKYLIDENGKLIEYYNPNVEPEDTNITKHLNKIKDN